MQLPMKWLFAVVALAVLVCSTPVFAGNKEGLVEHEGVQRDIFATGKASGVISLQSLAARPGLFAIGPIEGLDGEITIFDSKPYITQVRGTDWVVDRTFDHGAFFLVWTERTKWHDLPVPETVKGHLELQRFVKTQALMAGIDVTKPFPFLLAGTPSEIRWHINVDRTEGKAITRDLFVRSKESFVTKNEAVDIIGFYSENHLGVFIPHHAPGIPEGSDVKNAIHLHFVSRMSKAAGHIDDLDLGEAMVLRLPIP